MYCRPILQVREGLVRPFPLSSSVLGPFRLVTCFCVSQLSSINMHLKTLLRASVHSLPRQALGRPALSDPPAVRLGSLK